MPNLVRTLLSNTSGQVAVTGDPIPTNGPWRPLDGVHTVAVTVQAFHGRVLIEATLVEEPTDVDWFPIRLSGTGDALEFPFPEDITTGTTGTFAFTFRGRFRWLRARMDRNNIAPPPDPSQIDLYGHVERIVLAR